MLLHLLLLTLLTLTFCLHCADVRRLAFLEASLKSDADLLQWFRERLVWSDAATVNDLLRKGLMARLYEPQVGPTYPYGGEWWAVAWRGMARC